MSLRIVSASLCAAALVALNVHPASALVEAVTAWNSTDQCIVFSYFDLQGFSKMNAVRIKPGGHYRLFVMPHPKGSATIELQVYATAECTGTPTWVKRETKSDAAKTTNVTFNVRILGKPGAYYLNG